MAEPHAAAAVEGSEPSTRNEVAAALAGYIVDGMSTDERAAAVVMGHVGGTDPDRLGRYVADGRLGGFLLMGSNVPDDERALREVTDAVDGEDGGLPLLVAIDEEGGTVARLPWDDGPAGVELQGRDPGDAEAAFDERGGLLERAGITVNFGIVADVGTRTSGFIRPRALGADAAGASDRVAAAVAGERPYALSTLKHFPGHGAAPGDSHSVIPETSLSADDWRTQHAPPFEAGIEAGAEMVMTGHLRFTEIDDAPASLSPRWYAILRDDLGFEGVAITDDLGMLLSSGDARYADPVRNAVTAIGAGADMVLMVAGSDEDTATEMAEGIATAVADGELPEDRLAEATTRAVAARVLASGLLDGPEFD
ncbi:glycoside hydrolase family 3 N-terminal domain-containing protein [Microbacterium marinilacus]|uniref:beta-N-acetylhexosaminidase n=1 Tax=Microbacterium marinilacus TaxID=415209 RepID=A0ABP7B449_9MICO|nr:glycoside hydrolase family 3 N-terminal domain-containing protein [Microbacterium marinilacus]